MRWARGAPCRQIMRDRPKLRSGESAHENANAVAGARSQCSRRGPDMRPIKTPMRTLPKRSVATLRVGPAALAGINVPLTKPSLPIDHPGSQPCGKVRRGAPQSTRRQNRSRRP
jgi:hypothetical protein